MPMFPERVLAGGGYYSYMPLILIQLCHFLTAEFTWKWDETSHGHSRTRARSEEGNTPGFLSKHAKHYTRTEIIEPHIRGEIWSEETSLLSLP